MTFLEMISRVDIWMTVAAIVIAFNAFLVALYKGLEKLDEVIPGDQKPVASAIKGVSDFLKKIIDIFGMNKKHE